MEAKEISKDGEGNHDYHGLVQIEKNAKKSPGYIYFIWDGYDGHTRSRLVSNYECALYVPCVSERKGKE